MAIRNNDLFLINSGNTSYQVSADNLQSSNGTLLVNRGGNSFKCPVSSVVDKIQNNDKLLVNRSGISYQVSGLEVRNWFVPPSILIPNISWYGTRTVTGSDSVSQSTFYDDNPNTGCVFRPEADGSKASLVGYFSNYWFVTNVIYKAWTSNIANGNWENDAYSADRCSLKIRSGTSNTTYSKGASKAWNVDKPLGLTMGTGMYALEVQLSRKDGTVDEIAVAGIEVYGYEVNSQGKPI